MKLFSWQIHNDGKAIKPGTAVRPQERLSWPRTIGIGAQHVLAMAGSTFVVPAITGFNASTTLFFSAIGTILFLIITQNRLPSYLGSSFAFIAPIGAATASGDTDAAGLQIALGGVLVVGILLALVGVLVHFAGTRWIEVTMPPIVTGAIVALIGLNLAPAAWDMFSASIGTGLITMLTVIIVTVIFRGILGRLSILVGGIIGSIVAAIRGEWDLTRVHDAKLFGLPEFITPRLELSVLALFIPVVLVLIAENIGHIKSVATMTGDNLDHVTGKALFADGLATTLAGAGGGSGTTTYAENIGVMAATRVYSTAAYWVAGFFALALSMFPKVGQFVGSLPAGVLGGLATVLFGMIAMLGARIWVENKVDFSNPINLTTAAIALIIGAADFTWNTGDMSFAGIALGTAAALIVYHGMNQIAKWRGNPAAMLTIATLPEDVLHPEESQH